MYFIAVDNMNKYIQLNHEIDNIKRFLTYKMAISYESIYHLLFLPNCV